MQNFFKKAFSKKAGIIPIVVVVVLFGLIVSNFNKHEKREPERQNTFISENKPPVYVEVEEAVVVEEPQTEEEAYLFDPSFYQSIFVRLSGEYENWVQVYEKFGPPEENIKGTMFVLGFDENGNPHNEVIYGDVAARIDEIRKEIPSPSPDLHLSDAEMQLYLELYAYSIDLANLSLYNHEEQDIRLRKQKNTIQNLLLEYADDFY